MLLKNAVKVTDVKAFDWVLFPGVEFTLRYHGRKQTTDILKSGYETIHEDGKVRQEFSAEKFSKEFVNKSIVGWTGMKLSHVADWMLIEDENADLEQEIEFNIENALFLYENWKPFEDWVTSIVHDLNRFRKSKVVEVDGTAKEVSPVAE